MISLNHSQQHIQCTGLQDIICLLKYPLQGQYQLISEYCNCLLQQHTKLSSTLGWKTHNLQVWLNLRTAQKAISVLHNT